jgi:hypothetical protein
MPRNTMGIRINTKKPNQEKRGSSKREKDREYRKDKDKNFSTPVSIPA